MSLRTNLAMFIIIKGTKPRADRTSPTIEKTQIELPLGLDIKHMPIMFIIIKGTKPRADRTSPTIEKTQIELPLGLDVKSLSLLNKKHTEMLPIWSLLKRLYPLPKSPAAVVRNKKVNMCITTAIICKR